MYVSVLAACDLMASAHAAALFPRARGGGGGGATAAAGARVRAGGRRALPLLGGGGDEAEPLHPRTRARARRRSAAAPRGHWRGVLLAAMPKATKARAGAERKGPSDADGGDDATRQRLVTRAFRGLWALGTSLAVVGVQYAYGKWRDARRAHFEEQRFERLRKQWELALARRLSVLRAGEGETVEWLNVALARMWDSTIAPTAAAETATYLDAKMESMLNATDAKTTFPGWVKGIKMGEVNLGTSAPIIRSFAVPEGGTVDQTSAAGERTLAPDTLVDCAFEFISDDLKCSIELDIATNRVLRAIFRSKNAKIFVTVTNLRVDGVARLRLRPADNAVLAALTDTPALQMGLHLQGRIKQTRVNLSLTDLPGVQGLVETIINEVLAEGYVWPRFMPTFLPPPLPQDKATPSFGLVEVTVVEAAGIKQKQVGTSAAAVSIAKRSEDGDYGSSQSPWQQRAARLAGKGGEEIVTLASKTSNGMLGCFGRGGTPAPISPRAIGRTLSGRGEEETGRGFLDLSVWVGNHNDLIHMGLDERHIAKTEYASDVTPGRSILRVHLAEARELIAKDAGGTSDPYAEVYVTGQSEPVKTKTVYRSLNPEWNTTFDIEVDTARPSMVMVRLFDEDFIGSDEFLGQVSLSLKMLQAESDRRKRLQAAGVDTDSATRPIWRRLEQRSARSSVAGDVKMAAYIVDVGTATGASSASHAANGGEHGADMDAVLLDARASAINGNAAPSDARAASPVEQAGNELDRQAAKAMKVSRATSMKRHAAYLFVRVDGARQLLNLDEGPGNLSDPYVVVELGGAVHYTRTIEDDLNPAWGEIFAFPIASSCTSISEAQLECTVFDDDEAIDECLGQCRLTLGDILQAGSEADAPKCAVGKMLNVRRSTIKLGCHTSSMDARTVTMALDEGPAKLRPMVDFRACACKHVTRARARVVPSFFLCVFAPR